MVDLSFKIVGTNLPSDHGYHLYAGLSRALPALHESNGIGVHPIRGRQIGDRQIALDDRSALVIRTPEERIGQLIQLAGKPVNIAGRTLRIGVPQVFPLRPTTTLRSRLVTIKLTAGLTEDHFRTSLARQLAALGISSEAIVTLGTRRTLRIKDKEVLGYEVLIEALTAAESLTLQEQGAGGRRHLGCGVFLPTKREGSDQDE